MAHQFAQRREYQPGAPLYAAKDLKFSGRPVAHGAVIPEEYISSPEQRQLLWRAGHANHTPKPTAYQMPPTLPTSRAELEQRKVSPPPSPAPAVPPAVTVQSPAGASSFKRRDRR